ncbi:MAG: helix-hairpin-helix domain-containing protein [Agitococcus sp.]|nr:helix-hairpin-helix domain-containing protein [Agitococcus sp.]
MQQLNQKQEYLEVQPSLVRVLFALTLATTPLVSYSGVYKCIDAAGKVSFQSKECLVSSASSEITLKSTQTALSVDDKAKIVNRNQKTSPDDEDFQTPVAEVSMHLVEINTASKADLQSVVDAVVAAQIIAERNNSQFRDWPDLVHRVVGLSAAQTAAMASISGLTVNGKSLDGVPPDAAMAAMLKSRRR